MLLAYLAVLLQPCAMAMGPEPDQHPQNCHQESASTEIVACLSQPALECGTDDLIFDSHDMWKQNSEAQVAMPIPDASVNFLAISVSRLAYFSRAPPAGGPPLNVRHCVFLK
jgi:hypothetical protein